MSDVIPRPSARVVLIDDIERLLLFSSHNELGGTARWYTPGAGLHPAETHHRWWTARADKRRGHDRGMPSEWQAHAVDGTPLN
jgi:hypothetical protein